MLFEKLEDNQTVYLVPKTVLDTRRRGRYTLEVVDVVYSLEEALEQSIDHFFEAKLTRKNIEFEEVTKTVTEIVRKVEE